MLNPARVLTSSSKNSVDSCDPDNMHYSRPRKLLLYLSSADDVYHERNILKMQIVPELRIYTQSLGIEITIVDMSDDILSYEVLVDLSQRYNT